MARKRSTRRQLRDDLDEDDDERPVRRRRPRRRWRLIVLLLAAVALVIAAPTIISKTPLRNLVLYSTIPPQAGRLSCAGASFSWLGSQTLSGVALVDPAGNPLAAAESLTVNRTLIALAFNQADLGKIAAVRPTVHLDTRDAGSNLEDFTHALASTASAVDDSSKPKTSATAEIQIIEGTILARDFTTGQQWRVDALSATAHTAPLEITGAGVLTLAASQRLAGAPPTDAAISAPNAPGHFKFHLHHPDATRQQLELIADRLPLAPLEPWLARVLPQARLTGAASADLKLSWTPTSEPRGSSPRSPAALNLLAAGKIDATAVRFTAAALSGDILELPTASLSVDAALQGHKLTATNIAADSDWLEAKLQGDFDIDQLKNFNLDSLPTADALLTARVDLPQLTRMLPRTLHLRPGVRIDSGSLELTARSEVPTSEASRGVPAPGASVRTWSLAAAVQDLLGSDGTRPIRWTQPVEAAVAAVDTPAGPQLQRAALDSSFATATAETVDEGLQGKIQFNLEQLASQLGQFVDLSAWKLQGTGAGELILRNTGADSFVATAEMDLRDVDVQRAGKVVWVDPELRLELQANGARTGLEPKRIEKASALMRGPRDTLSVELLEAIDLAAADHAWLVRLTGNGPIDSWAGRLRPWLANVPDELAGQSTLTARLRLSANLIEVAESKLSVENLTAKLGATAIVEPRLEAAGDFRWDGAASAIQSHDLQFTTSTVAARARGLSLRFADQGPPTASGVVAFRGDLERVAAWFGLVGGENFWPRGQSTGRLQLASDSQQATANINFTADNLQLVRAPQASRGVNPPGPPGPPGPSIAWNDPRLEFTTQATYTHADDRLQLAGIKLQGQTVQINGAGVVEQLRTAGIVRGDLNVTYDAAEFAKLLATYLGPGVQLQGANTARLQATGKIFPAPSPSRGGLGRGEALPISAPQFTPVSSTPPHWSRHWQLTTETALTAANFYGLPVGATRVTANVGDGQINFSPLGLAVGQGRINLQPRVVLDPPPQRLELAGGQLISNVAISAEVSDRMLKYAAPMIAGATRTEGTFSLFLEGAHVPLADPKQTRADARLTIHTLSVTPGPMIQEVAALIRQLEALSRGGNDLAGGLNLGLGLLAGSPRDPGQPIKGITMTERTIDVRVIEGRVYHRNLEFLIDDVPVRSQGYVGFDESMSIVIEVPIQAKWVGDRPALKSLVGQVLSIPVTGTLTRWNIDERAIGAFLAQAFQAAAPAALGEELNRALDKLLKPK